jgi:hypothetical protein
MGSPSFRCPRQRYDTQQYLFCLGPKAAQLQAEPLVGRRLSAHTEYWQQEAVEECPYLGG